MKSIWTIGLGMLLLTGCSVQDLRRVGPLDKRPEWQKTSPYTAESQARRQGFIEKEVRAPVERKLPAYW